MGIAVTNLANSGDIKQSLSGSFHRKQSITVTGLTASSANTIPHGLPFTPTKVSLRPGANGLWAETSIPDATNCYITVGGGGATAGTIDLEE